MKNIWVLGFEETPNYEKLRFDLLRALLDQDLVPKPLFDWQVCNHAIRD